MDANLQFNQMLKNKTEKTRAYKKQMNLNKSFKPRLISQIHNPLNLKPRLN